MDRHILKIEKQTDNEYLNMYIAEGIARDGSHFPYYFTSRRSEADIVAKTGDLRPDGAVIFAVKQEAGKDYLVLVKQYRFPVNMSIYELPAGLIDAGETCEESAIRELHEETGLTLQVYRGGSDIYRRSYIQAQGICDECNSVTFGYATGELSTDGLEAREELEIVLADRREVKRILENEPVSLRGAYLMMMFLQTPEGQPFKFLDI
jgi:ADP-ribose pyrophosphatase